MTSAKKIRDLFKSPRGHTKKGNAGYDNARENIDPQVKTKVLHTNEIRQGANNINENLIEVKGALLETTGTAPSGVQPANLKAWFKADAGITKDGVDAVTVWADQSGNGNNMTQAAAGQEPLWVDAVLNGLPIIRFDGISQWLDSTVADPYQSAAGGNHTVFIIAKNSVGTSSEPIYGGLKNNTGQGYGFHSGRLERLFIRADSSGAEGTMQTPTGVMTTWRAYSARMSDGDTKLYMDGSQVDKTTDNISTLAVGDRIGRSYNAAYKWFSGDIAEIILYNAKLSIDDMEEVLAYLANKYAIDVKLGIWLQQEDYAHIKDGDGDTILQIDKQGNQGIKTPAVDNVAMTIKGDANIDGSLGVTVPPIKLSSDKHGISMLDLSSKSSTWLMGDNESDWWLFQNYTSTARTLLSASFGQNAGRSFWTNNAMTGGDGQSAFGFNAANSGNQLAANANMFAFTNDGTNHIAGTEHGDIVFDRFASINTALARILAKQDDDGVSTNSYMIDRYSDSPAAGDNTRGVIYRAENDNDEQVELAVITFYSEAIADGSEGGAIAFGVANTSDGLIDEALRIISGGNVGIATTTPDTKLQVVGDTKFGDDDTNYVTTDATGNLVFVGGAGLCFAGISMYDNATADSIATATSTQLVRFDTNDPSNNCTPDHTSDDITIIKAGMYMVTMSVAFSGTGSVTWTGGVYKNNGATQLANLQTHRKLGASGDVGSATVTGIADFAANDTVEIWFMQSSGVNKSITVKDCTLSVVQVGGT